MLYVLCNPEVFFLLKNKQTMHSRKTHVMISVSSASWLDKQDHLYIRLLIDLSRSFMKMFFYKLFCLVIKFTCVELYPFKYLWHFDDLGIISRSQQYSPTESVYLGPASQNSFTLHNIILLFVWRKSQKLCFFDNLGMYLWK